MTNTPLYEIIIVAMAMIVVFVTVGIAIFYAFGYDDNIHDLVIYNVTKIDCNNMIYSTNQTLNIEIMKYCIGKGGEEYGN